MKTGNHQRVASYGSYRAEWDENFKTCRIYDKTGLLEVHTLDDIADLLFAPGMVILNRAYDLCVEHIYRREGLIKIKD